MPHASKTPAEAVEHYRGRTVRLLSCVTAVHVVVRAYHLSDTPHDLELADTAKMRGGPFSIDVAEEYEVRQDTDGWHVEILHPGCDTKSRRLRTVSAPSLCGNQLEVLPAQSSRMERTSKSPDLIRTFSDFSAWPNQ